MFCMQCGKQIPDSAAFCPQCGEPVADFVADILESAPAQDANTWSTPAQDYAAVQNYAAAQDYAPVQDYASAAASTQDYVPAATPTEDYTPEMTSDVQTGAPAPLRYNPETSFTPSASQTNGTNVNPPEKKSKAPLIIGIVVALAVIAGAVFALNHFGIINLGGSSSGSAASASTSAASSSASSAAASSTSASSSSASSSASSASASAAALSSDPKKNITFGAAEIKTDDSGRYYVTGTITNNNKEEYTVKCSMSVVEHSKDKSGKETKETVTVTKTEGFSPNIGYGDNLWSIQMQPGETRAFTLYPKEWNDSKLTYSDFKLKAESLIPHDKTLTQLKYLMDLNGNIAIKGTYDAKTGKYSGTITNNMKENLASGTARLYVIDSKGLPVASSTSGSIPAGVLRPVIQFKELAAGKSTEFSIDVGKGYKSVELSHITYVPANK